MDEYWPIELDNPPSDWPTKPETQVRFVKIYKVYMSVYEKTYSKEAALEYCMRKCGAKKRMIMAALSFTRALIAAIQEQEKESNTTT